MSPLYLLAIPTGLLLLMFLANERAVWERKRRASTLLAGPRERERLPL